MHKRGKIHSRRSNASNFGRFARGLAYGMLIAFIVVGVLYAINVKMGRPLGAPAIQKTCEQKFPIDSQGYSDCKYAELRTAWIAVYTEAGFFEKYQDVDDDCRQNKAGYHDPSGFNTCLEQELAKLKGAAPPTPAQPAQPTSPTINPSKVVFDQPNAGIGAIIPTLTPSTPAESAGSAAATTPRVYGKAVQIYYGKDFSVANDNKLVNILCSSGIPFYKKAGQITNGQPGLIRYLLVPEDQKQVDALFKYVNATHRAEIVAIINPKNPGNFQPFMTSKMDITREYPVIRTCLAQTPAQQVGNIPKSIKVSRDNGYDNLFHFLVFAPDYMEVTVENVYSDGSTEKFVTRVLYPSPEHGNAYLVTSVGSYLAVNGKKPYRRWDVNIVNMPLDPTQLTLQEAGNPETWTTLVNEAKWFVQPELFNVSSRLISPNGFTYDQWYNAVSKSQYGAQVPVPDPAKLRDFLKWARLA